MHGGCLLCPLYPLLFGLNTLVSPPKSIILRLTICSAGLHMIDVSEIWRLWFLQFLLPFLNKGVMSASFHLLGNWPSEKDLLTLIAHIDGREPMHIPSKCALTNRQAHGTYELLDSLNLVDRTIDVRKLRADNIVEIRKVITIFGCNHRRVKLIHDLNNAEVLCQS